MVCCLISLIVISGCCLAFGVSIAVGTSLFVLLLGLGAGLFCFAGLLAVA